MKTLDTLKEGDYIAFGFNYNGNESTEIMVDSVTIVEKNKILVYFLYGHHSLSEWVKRKDILAIGCSESIGKIKGWIGTFNILNKESISKIQNGQLGFEELPDRGLTIVVETSTSGLSNALHIAHIQLLYPSAIVTNLDSTEELEAFKNQS